jgi:glycosyltransferase involved in cell wall biosynthesis
VGRIVKRKKLDVVIKSLKILNSRPGQKYTLEVVGSGEGSYMAEIRKEADESVIFHGQIVEFDVLLEIYRRSHIFVMPSRKETFGLVYVEALSQGLPIVYCKNEGVDGFFENKTVGVAVEPNSAQDVVEGINHIVEHYNDFHLKTPEAAKRFNWNKITQEYVDTYKSITSKKSLTTRNSPK